MARKNRSEDKGKHPNGSFENKGSTKNSKEKLDVNPRMSQLQKQLQAHEEEIKSNMSKLKRDKLELKEREQDILDRQHYLLQQNGGMKVSGSDIIKLNISGTEMFARRDTLTVVQGSRLDALFSGRWENQLMRDELGRVFMELDPDAFKKILEYLYIIKLSDADAYSQDTKNGTTCDTLFPPVVSKEVKEAFDMYIDFFRIKEGGGGKNNIDANANKKDNNNSSVNDIICHERAILDVMTKELDEMEKRLVAEESFVKLFLAESHKTGRVSSTESLSSSSFSSSSDSSNSDGSSIVDVMDKISTPPVVNKDLGILNLLVCGEIIVAKRSTLCLAPNSKLAQDFSSDQWLHDHAVITKGRDRCFLVEQPLSAFRKLLRHLRIRSIASDKNALIPIELDLSKADESNIFKRVFHYYFADGSNMFKIKDSVIVTDPNDQKKLNEFEHFPYDYYADY